MPGFDGTGPMGQGVMTGRGLGPCSRGYAIRRDRGFGFRKIMPTQSVEPTKEQETQTLENEAKAIEEEQKLLKQELEAINKKVNELKSKK